MFADKSRFYEGSKVIATIYVNSEDGLKVQDYPSLKSADSRTGFPSKSWQSERTRR